jgi:hypothetical protein
LAARLHLLGRTPQPRSWRDLCGQPPRPNRFLTVHSAHRPVCTVICCYVNTILQAWYLVQ